MRQAAHRQMAVARAHGAYPQRRHRAGEGRLRPDRRPQSDAQGHPVRLGDVVTLALDRTVRILKVEGFCDKRGDAPAARSCTWI